MQALDPDRFLRPGGKAGSRPANAGCAVGLYPLVRGLSRMGRLGGLLSLAARRGGIVIVVIVNIVIARVIVLVVGHFLVRGERSLILYIIAFVINSPLALGGGVLRGVGSKFLWGLDDASGSATRRFGARGLARVGVHGLTQWKSC